MRDLNIDFLELYKGVDKFIREAYSSTDGVSEYIRIMEQNIVQGRRHFATWQDDLGSLKHLRQIRNQLVHEVGYDSDLCEESDFIRLKDFKDRLYDCRDPLTTLRKAEEEERKRLSTNQRRQQARRSGEDDPFIHPSNASQTCSRKTLWERIKSFFTRT